MRRIAKIAWLGSLLLSLATVAPSSTKAQDANGASPAALPAKPEQAAKPDPFAPPNPYEYPKAVPAPFDPSRQVFDTIPQPIATHLEPYRESQSGPTQDGLPQAQNEIRVYTNEVIAPVTVMNKRGQLVLDLEQKDFHIFDNGVEQKIVHWDLGGDPLAVALVIETSSHIEMIAPVIRGMGSILTETVMALNGEAAVITFDSTVELRQPFTKNHDAIQRALAAVQFEAPEIRLHDAMATAVDLLKAQPPNFRRVMLVIGESQDAGSGAKLRFVLRDAQLANIAIYGIGVSSSKADLLSTMHASGTGTLGATGGSFSSPDHRPYVAPSGVAEHAAQQGAFDYMSPAIWLITRGVDKVRDHQLELAVAATGGVHYHAHRDRTILEALDQIGTELHAQYVVGYAPAAQPVDGFHEIKVTVTRPDTTLRTRPGYFLAPPDDATAPASVTNCRADTLGKSSTPE